MKDEGIDDDIIRAIKINAFPDILKKVMALAKRFKSSVYRNSVIDKMAILFENVDKRSKRMIAKIFKEKNIDVPVLKLQKPSAQLVEHIKNNVDLIKSVTDEHVDELTKVVFRAARNGFSPEFVKDEVLKQGKVGLAHAKFISRDQLAKASAAINEERQKDSGIPGYIWIVTNDSHTRNSHRFHHNKFYSWDNPPVIDFTLDDPNTKRLPENLNPGEDYSCRCIAMPAFGPEDTELLSPKIQVRTYAG